MKTVRYKTKTKAELEATSNATLDRLERERGAEAAGVRTNIVMEEPLIAEAQTITGIKTKTGVVHYALREVVRREKMKEVLAMRGKVKFWDGYVDAHVKP